MTADGFDLDAILDRVNAETLAHLKATTSNPPQPMEATMTDTSINDDEQVDPYAHIDDDELWLATPPPTEFGPAIHAILRDIRALTDEQCATLKVQFEVFYFANQSRYTNAAEDLDEQLSDHPIGSSSSCVRTSDISSWAHAVHQRFGEGPSMVLQAVAARDHGLINAEDFALFTDWWTAAGMALPDPISDEQRAVLTAWWDDDDA